VLALGGMGAVRRDHGTDAANDLAHAEKALELAVYDKNRLISDRELRRIMPPEDYADELASLIETVTEAQIALEMARSIHSTPPATTPVGELWDTWTMESRREWLGNMVASVRVKSANRKHGVPTAERVRIDFADFDDSEIAWEKVNAEPFADAVSRMMSSSRRRRTSHGNGNPVRRTRVTPLPA
jgi:hypothetical protein